MRELIGGQVWARRIIVQHRPSVPCRQQKSKDRRSPWRHFCLFVTVNSNIPPTSETLNSSPLDSGEPNFASKLIGGGEPDASDSGVMSRSGSVIPILYLPTIAPLRPFVSILIVPELSAEPVAERPEPTGRNVTATLVSALPSRRTFPLTGTILGPSSQQPGTTTSKHRMPRLELFSTRRCYWEHH